MIYDDGVGTEVAAVVNLHTEGSAATPTVISAWRAVNAARVAGIDAELVLVLDTPDAETTHMAGQWEARGASIVTCAVGDLGAARNLAAETVDAEWIAFLDGDDLWSESWLVDAHTAATAATASMFIDVWHPALSVIFGDHHSLLHHIPSTDPLFSWARFRLHNAWTALCFVRVSHLRSVPYPRNDLATGYGFEDWSWNEEILRRGGRHQVVPDTCHFIRRGSGTLLGQSQAALRSFYKTPESIARLDPDRLPGATTEIQELSPTDPDLPATHRHAPVDLSPKLREAVRLATVTEPAIAETLGPDDTSQSLPQNFNTHVTSAQRALESIYLEARVRPYATTGELCETASDLLAQLSPNDRARVVADVIIDPSQQDIPRGTSELIAEAIHHYPQLLRTTW